MHPTRILLSIIALITGFTSCIEEYSPVIKESNKNKYAILGKITDNEGYQYVTISVSSPLIKPILKPLSGCHVDIIDSEGNNFHLAEYSKGNYRVWISKEHLKPGVSFQLIVQFDNGEKIISESDVMPAKSPSVDSVYYKIKNRPTNIPGVSQKGLQFFIDLKATNSTNRYFKWEFDETWEYHSFFPIEYIWNGKKTEEVIPVDYSLITCWRTTSVNDIFTLSTKNLSSNSYNSLNIHFVGNLTQRLVYGYSLLVRQQAINEKAYYYWDQVRINNNQNGGLYSQQPFSIVGNLKFENSSEDEVFGIFYVASESQKRFFFHEIKNLDFDFSSECNLVPAVFKNIAEVPCYVVFRSDSGEWLWAQKSCFDCRLSGGTIFKPDFWPIK